MHTHWFGAWPRAVTFTATLIALVLALPGAVAQQGDRTAVNTTVPANAQALEPGDVYLPGSGVYVFVGKTGFGHEHAIAGRIKAGRISLDAPTNSGELVFDMTTFMADTTPARQFIGLAGTTDASTQQQVTNNMLGPDVLDVRRYPTATFTVRSVAKLPQPSTRGLPHYQLTGDFTLHGVTRPIQVLADAEENNGWIHLRGGFTMVQTHFGIRPYAIALGAVGVTDQLKVWGDLWIAKQRQVPSTSGL